MYNIGWDGTNLKGVSVPNGIYFCQLKVGDKTAEEKLVRLK
jgi:flagellar hook assembly protein FlgD